MKRILITGGSGFIGTNLVDFYSQQENTVVLNLDILAPRNSQHAAYWKQVDLMDFEKTRELILDFSPTHVLHMAARTDLDESHNLNGYAVNFEAVKELLQIFDACNDLKRAVFASSMLVCRVGYNPQNYTDYSPPNIYGQSKVMMENIIRARTSSRYEWCIVRPTSIWGPWFGAPYSDFFEMVMGRRFFKLSGRGATKTFGYVGNAVAQINAMLTATKSMYGKTIYLGDKVPYNINEWADEIAAGLNIKLKSVPTWVLKAAGLAGDVLTKINIPFPMTTFRYVNMTTDNLIFLLKDTVEILPEQPFSRKEGIDHTLQWIQSKNRI